VGSLPRKRQFGAHNDTETGDDKEKGALEIEGAQLTYIQHNHKNRVGGRATPLVKGRLDDQDEKGSYGQRCGSGYRK